VTLSSKHYSLYATYNPTQGGTAPVNTVAPSITGQPQQGQVLTGSDGTWTGTQPITYARQWLRCDTGGGNCSPIGGATGSAYSITSSDVSSTIRFQVTGTNSAGSTSAQSAQTATITGGAPPPGPPPSGSANVWVDGGSGSCSRSASATTYVASSACNDLGSAYRAAHDGDTVGVVGGHYPAQEIDYSSGKSSSGPAVTFVPSGGVTIDSVSLGGNANGCIPAAPNWVTFDGGTNKNFAIHNFGACVTDHVTVERTQIGVDVATLGALAEFHSPQNFVFTNNVVGPACCGYDGTHGSSPIELRLAISSGDPNPTNVQVTNNRFQGSARTCAGWNSAFASQYGPCPATTCPDFDQCHNDAIHVYGCTNCTFDSNRFPYFDVQGIYLEEVNGSEQSGTIENNVFGHDIEGAWHTIWASFGQTTGTWNIRFNTLTEQNAIDANASDQHGRYGTGTINVVGNLGGRLGNDTGSCGGSSLNVVYRYNMWATSSVPWISHCDPTDGGPFDPLTISSWLSGDGHLLSGSSPPNGFVTGAGLCIGKDIDGDTRPATGCAAGSDEYEPG
jgi:hypothetical protein